MKKCTYKLVICPLSILRFIKGLLFATIVILHQWLATFCMPQAKNQLYNVMAGRTFSSYRNLSCIDRTSQLVLTMAVLPTEVNRKELKEI